jgi:hypothetical protein
MSFGAHHNGFSTIEQSSPTARDLRAQIHAAVYDPTAPQVARIPIKAHTSSNPPNTVVWSRNSSLWSEIELTIPTPLFYSHTTPDPMVASDSSFTSFSANSPNQITFTTTTLSTNMSTIPPKMPTRGHHSAPKFEGTAHSLNRFFSDIEYQADISQLDKAQKKQDVVRYLSIKQADFWMQRPEWADALAIATWAEFKTAIRKAYPGSEANERTCILDMDALVGATQHITIHDLGEFSKFYRKFCTIVEYLAKQNRIGTCKIATNFLCALPADLQQKIIFRIQICNPNRHVDKPHTLKSLFEAGIHILEGTMILDTMNPYTAAAAYVQPQSQAGQMHQPVQQVQVNYPHNVYIPGTSISSPYRFYAPPVVPPPQFPYAQQTVPVHQPTPPAAQSNTFQPLPYAPGFKQQDIMTIATTVVSVFAKQLTPLFQQQPRGNATTNAGQNCTMFTCAFCGQAGHGIRDCNIAQMYITENRIR